MDFRRPRWRRPPKVSQLSSFPRAARPASPSRAGSRLDVDVQGRRRGLGVADSDAAILCRCEHGWTVRRYAGRGWHLELLAEAAGINDRTAWQTLHGYTTPSPHTAAAVEEVYEALKLEDPGDGAAAVRSRLRAERHGWNATTSEPSESTAPEDLVDQVAVDRAVHGDPVPLRPPEQQAALRRLAGGHSDDEIGRRLGVASRTVLRHRMSQGLPAYSPSSASPTSPSR